MAVNIANVKHAISASFGGDSAILPRFVTDATGGAFRHQARCLEGPVPHLADIDN